MALRATQYRNGNGNRGRYYGTNDDNGNNGAVNDDSGWRNVYTRDMSSKELAEFERWSKAVREANTRFVTFLETQSAKDGLINVKAEKLAVKRMHWGYRVNVFARVKATPQGNGRNSLAAALQERKAAQQPQPTSRKSR